MTIAEVLTIYPKTGEAKSCEIADYPLEVDGAIAVKHNGQPAICGGYQGEATSNCYKYQNGEWQKQRFQLTPAKSRSTTVEIRPGEFLILGGHDGISMTRNGERFKNGRFSNGPRIPLSGQGSAVMYDDKRLFWAMGILNDKSSSVKNYFFNIDTNRWTELADRTLEASTSHVSGTFFNSSAGELQIANIGFNGIEVYSPRANSWHRITNSAAVGPKSYSTSLISVHSTRAIQHEKNSFLLIGGSRIGDYGQDFTGDIFLFDENGLSVLKENVLITPRQSNIAMQISDDFTCEN